MRPSTPRSTVTPPQRPQHRRVGHLDHAQRRGRRRHAHGRGERRDHVVGRAGVQVDIATEDTVRIHVAQRQVGVGHGRSLAALGVAGRAREGAGALRPHHERAVIEPGDGAAAGPDGLHCHHGLAQGSAAEGAVARDLRRAALDQADIGGGAAHVEADGALDPQRPGHAAGRGHACGGARGGKSERQVAQRRRRSHAARGVEEVQPGVSGLLRLQVVEISRRQRHDAGAQRRGRRPLVLPRLGIDPVRERDEGEALAQPRAQGLLVRGVGVGMQQRDGDRLGPARLDAPDRVCHRVRVQCGHDPAVVVEPLAHLEAALRGHLGLELGR